jgi:anthranilate phosphoribosyltransferase
VELRDGRTRALTLTPSAAGVEPAPLDQAERGTPEDNAEMARAVLSGRDGPERALALINAGGALYVAGRTDSMSAGVKAAVESIDSGAAEAALRRFVERTRELAPAT